MKRLVHTIFLGYITGIVSLEILSLSSVFTSIILVLVGVLFFLYYFVPQARTFFTLLTIVFLFGALLGAVRTFYAYENLPQKMLEESIGQKVTVQGTIISAIDTREKHSSFLVKLDETHANQKVLVRAQRIHSHAYGDVVTLAGTLQTTRVKDKNFALYEASLVRSGVYYRMQYPTITPIGTSTPSQVKLYALAAKESVYEKINESIHEPVAGLTQGLVLGEKRALSQEWYDTFQRVGMTHVIVLSGYNVAILFTWVIALFFFVPFRARYMIGILSVVFLVLVSGADAPAVRAGILVSIVALAALLRRQVDAGYFVTIALFGMIMFNPFYLLFDISFQLSALATYGLVYVAPLIEISIKKIATMNIFTEALRDTIAAQIMVLPIQIYFFKTIPLISLFSNTFLLPFVPLLMIGSIITYVSGLVSSSVGIFFGSIVTFLGNIFLWCVTWFDSVGTVVQATFSLSEMIGVYLSMIIFYCILQKDETLHS